MDYTFTMDLSPLPFGPPRLFDLPTIHLLVTATFVVQAMVIAFHAFQIRRYRGIRMFLASTIVLATSSGLHVAMGWIYAGSVWVLSGLLFLAGVALQYAALARFVGLNPSKLLITVVAGGGTLTLLVLGILPGPTPFVAAREILTVPFLVAAAWVLHRADTTDFRLGAWLTALPFGGYAILSTVRIVRGVLDPTQMVPGPNLNNDLDAFFFFILNFLWSAGFLFMVNQRLQADLTALANRDSLTGCLNRRAMNQKLDDEQNRFLRYRRPFSVVLLDLDRFKTINDTWGHETGDRVLITAASLVSETLRAGDQTARWGGEEFLLLLPETDAEAATALAERLRTAVQNHRFEPGGLEVTFSAGVAGARGDEDIETLCRRADQALYRAKETRNRVVRAD